MVRYFMHLRDGTDEVLDPEGVEYPDLAALRKAVLFAARDLMKGDVAEGVLDFRFRIDAEDETGGIVYTLAFKDALHIVSPETLAA